MKLFLTYVFLFFLSLLTALESYPDRDARGNHTENFTHLQVSAALRMGSVSYREGEDVELEFKVSNHGKEVVRIFPANDWRQTFQLQIRDETNRLVEAQEFVSSDSLQIRRNTQQNLAGDLSKEISLSPGESFTYKILLQEQYQLATGKKYFITGYFYPNATESKKNIFLGGNQSEGMLSFLRTENTVRFFYEARRKEPLRSPIADSGLSTAAGVSPEETIFLFLGAELKKNWAHYYKWVHIPDYILAYDQFAGVYLNSTDRERELIEDEFKKYLSTQPSGRLKYFRVTDVERLTRNESKVKVYVERLEERIPTRYEYEYTLKKEDSSSLWKIYGIVARVRK